jgi:hypothetical protein
MHREWRQTWFPRIAVACILTACFQAWVEEHRLRTTAEAALNICNNRSRAPVVPRQDGRIEHYFRPGLSGWKEEPR